jgi:hypothetical protein
MRGAGADAVKVLRLQVSIIKLTNKLFIPISPKTETLGIAHEDDSHSCLNQRIYDGKTELCYSDARVIGKRAFTDFGGQGVQVQKVQHLRTIFSI